MQFPAGLGRRWRGCPFRADDGWSAPVEVVFLWSLRARLSDLMGATATTRRPELASRCLRLAWRGCPWGHEQSDFKLRRWARQITLGMHCGTASAQALVVVLSGSVALFVDPMRNLADALADVPRLIAFRLAGRAATKRYNEDHGQRGQAGASARRSSRISVGLLGAVSSLSSPRLAN